jgi:hypothetical protein
MQADRIAYGDHTVAIGIDEDKREGAAKPVETGDAIPAIQMSDELLVRVIAGSAEVGSQIRAVGQVAVEQDPNVR